MTLLSEKSGITSVYVALGPVVGFAAIVGFATWYGKRFERKLAQARTAFLQEVGGIEYLPNTAARPSFGFFPDAKPGDQKTPYSYAVQFSRSGYDVLAVEQDLGKHREYKYRYTVEIQIRIPPCPTLWMKQRGFGMVGPPDELIPLSLPAGPSFLFATSNERFARMLFNENVAEIIHNRLKGHVLETVLENGIARTPVPADRLDGRGVLPATDELIAFLRALPQRTWEYAKDHR